MKRMILGPLATAVLLIGAVGTYAATTPDPRLSQCGADTPGNRVLVSFEIPAAGRIWDYFPAMGMAPELLSDGGPAFVAVFDGDYTGYWMTKAGLTPEVVQDVVCVVTGDGELNVYFNVSRAGFVAP